MYKQKGFDSGNGSGKKGGKKKDAQDPVKGKSGTVAGQFLAPGSSNQNGEGGPGAFDVDTGRFHGDPDQFLKTDKKGFITDDDYRYNEYGNITHRNDSTGGQIFAAQEKRAAAAVKNKKKKK